MSKNYYNIAERLLFQQAQSQDFMEKDENKWNLCQSKIDNLWRSNSRLTYSELDCRSISHTLSELRQKFRIPTGRDAVKRIISSCMVCKRWKAKPFKLPPMLSLPESRVKRSRTFEQVGLDYLGPIVIKSTTAVAKRWVALFTCFTTKVVHLKLVEDLSAESFVHILRRFVARRGYLKLVLSDNASQFQLTLTSHKSANFLAEKVMVWRNTIPRAPWDGGVYERITGLIKGALRKAIGRKLLKEKK
ncbi:Integrase core domain containing protein [Dirofilaria immitis]|nr:Integrase core domain containing protein [Dirofilaria immitis]